MPLLMLHPATLSLPLSSNQKWTGPSADPQFVTKKTQPAKDIAEIARHRIAGNNRLAIGHGKLEEKQTGQKQQICQQSMSAEHRISYPKRGNQVSRLLKYIFKKVLSNKFGLV